MSNDIKQILATARYLATIPDKQDMSFDALALKASLVAKALIAEIPEDDDTKLTIDEAEKEFGARGHIDATISSHRGVVAVKIDDWIILETRGDLRTLLSILPPF